MKTLFIGGRWVESASESVRDITHPARRTVIDQVVDSDASDVDRAVRAAFTARLDWAGLSTDERARYLRDCLRSIEAEAGELALLETRETGAPLRETRPGVAAMLERARGQIHAPPASSGVTAVLGAAPTPLLAWVGGVLPLLAGGSTVVLKPASSAPLTSLRLAALCQSLPAGVLNVITGGSGVGRWLVEHADVAAVFYVGSSTSFSDVQKSAASRSVTAIVDSNDPLIVCADADIEVAVRASASARLLRSGQFGAAPRRFYVDKAVVGAFVTRLHEFVGLLDIDDPEKVSTEVGPLATRDAIRRAERQVANLMRAGATLVMGGFQFRPSGLSGHFMQTTILTNVPHSPVALGAEIAGPVITITPVDDLGTAIAMANETPRTVGATVFTRSSARAHEAAGALAAHTVWINDPLGDDPMTSCADLAGLPLSQNHRSDRVLGGVDVPLRPWWFAPRQS
jgi:acyl-CoA reductase-like NAD-dependent aldehyde dehydrogenase